MTTICVSRALRMMAAESNELVGEPERRSRSTPKLYRARDYIVGCCGDSDQIDRFEQWLKRRDGKRPRGNYEALLLYRDGRITHFYGSARETEISEDYYAIGTGESFAVAALDALELMGLPLDPRIAVQVACRRDPGSAEPINAMRWVK